MAILVAAELCSFTCSKPTGPRLLNIIDWHPINLLELLIIHVNKIYVDLCLQNTPVFYIALENHDLLN